MPALCDERCLEALGPKMPKGKTSPRAGKGKREWCRDTSGSAPKASAVPHQAEYHHASLGLVGAARGGGGWGDLLVISRVPLMQHSHIGTLGSLAASLGWGLRWAPEQEIRVRRRGGKNPQNPHGAGSGAAQLMGLPWRRSSEEEEKAENSPVLG